MLTTAIATPRSIGGGRSLGANTNLVRLGSWADSNYVDTTRSLLHGSGTLRYPGGGPANYWDWRTGWCLAEYSGHNYSCKGVSVRPYRLEDALQGATATGAQWLLTANVLTSNVPEQVAMLEAAQALGLDVRHVELGSELYWEDHFENGTTYAAALVPYIDAIRAAGFNSSAVTLYPSFQDTNGVNAGSKLGRWNAELAAGLDGVAGIGVQVHVYRNQDRRLDFNPVVQQCARRESNSHSPRTARATCCPGD